MVSLRSLLVLVLGIAIMSCAPDGADGAAPIPPKKGKLKLRPKTPNTQKPGQPVTRPMFNVPATPLTSATPASSANSATANGSTTTKMVEKEGEFTISDDAKVQRLQKYDSGLNFVTATSDDVMEGQLVTLSLLNQDKKDVQNVSGTIVKLKDNRVTLKMTVPMGQEVPDGTGKECTLISIRTPPADIKQ